MKQLSGGVVIGPGNKIVVVSQNGDSWSLPKGHLESGEDAESAAAREIFEETGIQDVKVIEHLATYQRSRIGKDGVGEDETDIREIDMFLCITNQSDLAPIDPENPEAKWLFVHEVADVLTHAKDKEFFSSITPKLLRFFVN